MGEIVDWVYLPMLPPCVPPGIRGICLHLPPSGNVEVMVVEDRSLRKHCLHEIVNSTLIQSFQERLAGFTSRRKGKACPQKAGLSKALHILSGVRAGLPNSWTWSFSVFYSCVIRGRLHLSRRGVFGYPGNSLLISTQMDHTELWNHFDDFKEIQHLV